MNNDESLATPIQSELIRRACDGDTKAFDALVTPYYRDMLGFAIKSVVDFNLAEDAVMKALHVAWIQIKRYRHQHSFENWLLAKARSFAIDAARRSQFRTKTRVSFETYIMCKPLHPNLLSTTKEVSLNELHSIATKVIEKYVVNKHHREWLYMRLFLGMEPIEISRKTHTPSPTVKSALSRNIKMLQEHFLREYQAAT